VGGGSTYALVEFAIWQDLKVFMILDFRSFLDRIELFVDVPAGQESTGNHPCLIVNDLNSFTVMAGERAAGCITCGMILFDTQSPNLLRFDSSEASSYPKNNLNREEQCDSKIK